MDSKNRVAVIVISETDDRILILATLSSIAC